MRKSLVDNFDFLLFGQGTKIPFKGYVSSIDPTTAGIGVLIGGSQNTYKSLLGTIRNRSGLKRRGPADATAVGVIRSYEWETSLGLTRVLRVIPDSSTFKLQVEFGSGSSIEWIDVLTGMVSGNLSFAPWYSEELKMDELIFVNGQQQINMWNGGVVPIATAANTAGIIFQTFGPNYNTIIGSTYGVSSGGIGYLVGDVLGVTGGNSDAQVEVDAVTAASAVAAVSVTAPGSNYTVGDFVKINGTTTFAILKITGVDGGGGVTSFTIQTTGLGYSTGAGQATTVLQQTSGTASGLTVNIGSLGKTISAWHFKNNGSGYSTGNNIALTGGTGTGATIAVTSIVNGRISITGDSNLAQLGFPGTLSPTSSDASIGGTIMVNGVTYSYDSLGDDYFSFIGISPDPTGLAGAVATALVTVSSSTASNNPFSSVFGAAFTNDFINTIGNQLYVGCLSKQIAFISASDNYLDFAVPSFRAPGDADLFFSDSNIRGFTSKTGQKGNAVIFGSLGDTYSLIRQVESFITSDGSTSFVYETVLVDKSTSADLSSPLGQDFIDSIGDTIIFIDGNNQLRQFGTLRNLATPVYPILSLDVYNELAAADLTGGELRAVAEQSGETVYITVPLTGILYIYQLRSKVDEVGNLTAERLWQPPFVVGCATVAVITGITYIYSNVNPQLYQLWDTGQYSDDSPSDEPLPYESHAITAYLSLPDRAQQMYFDKLYYEGYMSPGTNLYNNVYYEYQGAKNILTVTVNKSENPGKKPATFYSGSNTPSLGDVSLGRVSLGLGMSSDGGDNQPKFRALRRAQAIDAFEVALDVFSFNLDSQWEILVLGINILSTTRRPISIM